MATSTLEVTRIGGRQVGDRQASGGMGSMLLGLGPGGQGQIERGVRTKGGQTQPWGSGTEGLWGHGEGGAPWEGGHSGRTVGISTQRHSTRPMGAGREHRQSRGAGMRGLEARLWWGP